MTAVDIRRAIKAFDSMPLTEIQQALVNYLYANQDDIIEALEIDDFDDTDTLERELAERDLEDEE